MMDKTARIKQMAETMLRLAPATQHELHFAYACAEALYAAGYRKVPMVDCPCAKQPWDEPPCQACSDHESHGDWCICYGSGRIPERPKVLSEQDTERMAEQLAKDYPLLDFSFWDDYREESTLLLQSLREADIQHYEGVKDA